jgi:hypothetical protein
MKSIDLVEKRGGERAAEGGGWGPAVAIPVLHTMEFSGKNSRVFLWGTLDRIEFARAPWLVCTCPDADLVECKVDIIKHLFKCGKCGGWRRI